MVAQGLHCCTQAFASCGEWGLLFAKVCRLFILVASLAEEHRFCAIWVSVVVAWGLQSTRLSCPEASGIFSDQGIELVSLVLQGGFLTTGPPGKPSYGRLFKALSATNLGQKLS